MLNHWKEHMRDAGQSCCPFWELPGPFPAGRTGMHQALFCKRENESWALISPNFLITTVEQNKFSFGLQCKKINWLLSNLMGKAEADSQKLQEEKKKRTAPCKNSQLLLELVHQPLLLFFPLQCEFMVTPTLKSVNHKTTQDPALLQTKAQSSARVTGFIILYLLCHFPETRLFYFYLLQGMIQSVILSVFHSWFKTLQGTSWSKGRMPNSIFFFCW